MNLFEWLKPINTYGKEGDPFLNKKKYSVVNGSILVSAEELMKSKKVQDQLALIRRMKHQQINWI